MTTLAETYESIQSQELARVQALSADRLAEIQTLRQRVSDLERENERLRGRLEGKRPDGALI